MLWLAQKVLLNDCREEKLLKTLMLKNFEENILI